MTNDGWRWESLDDIARGGLFTDGDWVESRDQDPNGPVRLTQLADVGVGEFRHRSDRWMREDQATRLNCSFLRPADVLIARMPDPIGRACLVPDGLGRAVTAVDVAILRVARPEIDPKYVMWATNSPAVHQAIVAMQSGTTRKRISRKNLATIRIPIPARDEQRRIVAIVEEHLSDLDDAASSLRRASARCQALVTRSLSLVRSGDELPLPHVAVIQGGIQKQAKRTPHSNAFPFLRVANVTARGLELDEVHRVELFKDELTRYGLHAGDLLVVEGNGSPSQIGRAALWDGSIPDCVHQNHLIRVRPDREKIFPEYLEAVWNSPENRSVLTHVASSSSGLHTLSVRKLAQLQIPVPSLERQIAAVAELRQVRESVSRLQASISASAARGESLHRAVLTAAFAGRLTGHGADTEAIEELAEEESA